jgi:hypothetical protein
MIEDQLVALFFSPASCSHFSNLTEFMKIENLRSLPWYTIYNKQWGFCIIGQFQEKISNNALFGPK